MRKWKIISDDEYIAFIQDFYSKKKIYPYPKDIYDHFKKICPGNKNQILSRYTVYKNLTSLEKRELIRKDKKRIVNISSIKDKLLIQYRKMWNLLTQEGVNINITGPERKIKLPATLQTKEMIIKGVNRQHLINDLIENITIKPRFRIQNSLSEQQIKGLLIFMNIALYDYETKHNDQLKQYLEIEDKVK